MLKYLSAFLVILLSANLVTAETLTTKIETTTVISNDKIDKANFLQLISAIRSFHGKEISIEGKLEHFLNEEFWFYVNNNEKFEITIDDGRSVKKKALTCTMESPCDVSMTIELAVNSDYGDNIYLKGVGYDVTFIDQALLLVSLIHTTVQSLINLSSFHSPDLVFDDIEYPLSGYDLKRIEERVADGTHFLDRDESGHKIRPK